MGHLDSEQLKTLLSKIYKKSNEGATYAEVMEMFKKGLSSNVTKQQAIK